MRNPYDQEYLPADWTVEGLTDAFAATVIEDAVAFEDEGTFESVLVSYFPMRASEGGLLVEDGAVAYTVAPEPEGT